MDDAVFTFTKLLGVPALTVGTSVLLFWLKFHADARKKLDDLLIELEHAIYLSPDRPKVFAERYLEIRKAVTEFDRWIIDPYRKKELREAFRRFRGQRFTTASIFDLRGGPHESMIDVFLTSGEVRVLAPAQGDFAEYLQRIAAIRKITGSRAWADPEHPAV